MGLVPRPLRQLNSDPMGAAILLTIGLVGWWQLLSAGPTERAAGGRKVGRAILVAAAVMLIAFGVYGVASRAYHFRVTWTYAAELNRVLLDHQRSLPADKDRVISVFLPPACTEGLVHCQYVETPVDALCAGRLYLKFIEAWFNRRDPLRRLRLVWGALMAPACAGRPGIGLRQLASSAALVSGMVSSLFGWRYSR